MPPRFVISCLNWPPMPMPITLGKSYATNAQSGRHLKTPVSRGVRERKISNRPTQSIQRACALHYFVRHASFLILIQIGLVNLRYGGT